MNKYHEVLSNIIKAGKTQSNKKGNIRYLLNYHLVLKPIDLLSIFETHPVARNKLKGELQLFMQGERNTEAYRKIGISWWDYCGPVLVNTYPTYFEKLPTLIKRINSEQKHSKNYVLYLGANTADTNQQPCLSVIQFQIDHKDRLIISAYQRSSDASLGLPADIYHLYLISRHIRKELHSISLFLANVHIYENNIKRARQLLKGQAVKFSLNV